MSNPSKIAHRIIEIIMHEWSNKCFSICLLPSCQDLIYKNKELLKHGVCFHYKIPDNLCRIYRKDNKILNTIEETKPLMSTSAILALFDEISTYSCAIKDRNHRPGVSLHLTTEIIHPKQLYANESIKIMTHTDKIGKTIGFCSMEILSSDNIILARGKHIKFLDTGIIFDYLLNPYVFPIILQIYDWFFAKKTIAIPKDFPSIDGIGKVFNILGLNKIVANDVSISYDDSDTTANNILHHNDNTSYYAMKVNPITRNMLGNLHGGALGVAIEHVCILSRITHTNNNNSMDDTKTYMKDIEDGKYNLNCFVKSIEIRYIAAMSGDIVITSNDDLSSSLLRSNNSDNNYIGNTSASYGQILRRKDNQLCAEYTCHWSLL